jgi:hypothetical protein
MNKIAALAVVLATVGATALVSAESLEEKKYWKGEADYLNNNIESANKDCDMKFTFDWVDKGKLRESAEKAGASPYGVCASIVDEVDSLCRAGADEKAAVKAKIKGFQCGYSKPRSLDFKGAVVKYMGNNEEANFSDWAKPWLMKRL